MTEVLSCAGCGAPLPEPNGKYSKCGFCTGVNVIEKNKVHGILTKEPEKASESNDDFKKFCTNTAVIIGVGLLMYGIIKKGRMSRRTERKLRRLI